MAKVTIYKTDGSLGESYMEAVSRVSPTYINMSFERRVELILNYFLDTNNAVFRDYQNGGYLKAWPIPDGQLQIDLDWYSILYTGSFSTEGSRVTSVGILDGAGVYTEYSGDIRYQGLPLITPLEGNSTVTALSRVEPSGSEGISILGNFIVTSQLAIQGQVEAWIYQGVDSTGKVLREIAGGGNLVFNNNSGPIDIISGQFTTVYVDTRNFPIVNPNVLLDYIFIEDASIPISSSAATTDILSGNDIVTLTGTRGSVAMIA